MLATAIGVMLASATLILLFVAAQEPKHAGRTISEWIAELDPHVEERARHDTAEEALLKIGPDAVPVIHRILAPQSGRLLAQAKPLLQRMRLLPPDRLSQSEMQYRAARAAYKLAEAGKANIDVLVPALIPHVTESNYLDSEAGRALAAAGPKGIEALIGMLKHADARVRDRAIYSLCLVREAPGVMESFLRMVDDPDRNVRFAALSGLSGRVKTDPNVTVPIGLRFLEKQDDYERWAGARLLSAYSEDPRAEEALRNCLKDPDENVRRTAERALKQLEKERNGGTEGP